MRPPLEPPAGPALRLDPGRLEHLKALWAQEYPLRRPENSYRIFAGRADIRNYFLPDRHEQLNETGTEVLELCGGEHSLIEIWEAILDRFQVPSEEEALGDVVRMVRYFQRFHLVYPSTVRGEQRLDVRHPRQAPTTTPVPY